MGTKILMFRIRRLIYITNEALTKVMGVVTIKDKLRKKRLGWARHEKRQMQCDASSGGTGD